LTAVHSHPIMRVDAIISALIPKHLFDATGAAQGLSIR
jgi:hypothetical protein